MARYFQNISLYSKNLPLLKDGKLGCRSFDYSSGDSFEEFDLSSFNNMRIICNISFLIMTLVILIGYCPFFFGETKCFSRGCHVFPPKRFMFANIYVVSLSIILSVIIIIVCANAISNSSKFKQNIKLINDLSEANCFEYESYNTIFSETNAYIMKSFGPRYGFNTANLIISILLLILCILYFPISIFMAKKESLIENSKF